MLNRRLARRRQAIGRSSTTPIMESLRRRLLHGLLAKLALLESLKRLLLFGRSSSAARRFSSVMCRLSSVLLLRRSVPLSPSKGL